MSYQQDPNQQDPNQQWGQGQQQNQGQGGVVGDIRRMAEDQVDQIIDQLGNKIPGGSGYTQQAKEAAHGIIGNLEQEAERRLRNIEGGNQGS